MNAYFRDKNQTPSKTVLLIETKEDEKVSSKDLDNISNVINEIYSTESLTDEKWLLESSEKWCQDREMYLSIVKSIAIYDGSEKKILPTAIPDLMRNALSVSFKTNIGTDWFDDASKRFDNYEVPENKIPFGLETLNDVTLGGVTRKTLSLILAGVHVGKTLTLVHLASDYARLGYNVLYISMEMGEMEIMHRIDANMTKTPMHLIKEMGKEKFMGRIGGIKSRGYGKIKAIQFPTSMAHVRAFL